MPRPEKVVRKSKKRRRKLAELVAQNIQNEREIRDMSRADLGEKMGRKRQSGRSIVHNIEVHHRGISLMTLSDIADAMELDPADLLDEWDWEYSS